jgi:polyisoprenoid-binding protein YceI
MKKMYFALMALATVSLASCGGAEKSPAEEETKQITYNLDADATSLKWEGKYVSDGHTHNGTVKITEGTVVYDGDAFKSGTFKVDLNTIENDDLPDAEKGKLVGHLKSGDFFNTEKQSIVPVTVTSVGEDEVKATINVGGKDMQIVIPAKINRTDNKLTVKGKFEVDFATTDMNGFKPMDPSKDNEKVNSVISFDLDLVLKN